MLNRLKHSLTAAPLVRSFTQRVSPVKRSTHAGLRYSTSSMALDDSGVAITSAPRAGQAIYHDGKTYNTVREGRAFILVPPNARTSVDPQSKSKADDGTQAQSVFYNPIQQFNRDLSVLAIKAFGEDSCQRKRLRHDGGQAKERRRRDRKRARAANVEKEGEDIEGGPWKVRRLEDSIRSGTGDVTGGVERNGAVLNSADVASTPPDRVKESSTGDAPAQERSDIPLDQPHITNEADQELPTEEAQKATLQAWRPKLRILDALSATGLRALRYASEIPFATAVVANDRERSATNSILVNVEHNKLTSMITTTTNDALGHMYGVAFPPTDSHGPRHINGKYDVIDLDPYGTAAPFIDAALQALDDGGLLCVTCTDSGVFASCGYSEKTYALYGGLPIKGIHSHEGGLRLILHSVASTASKYGLAIEPLLSLSIDFYARLFIRVRRSPLDVKFLAGKTMLVYSCDHGCGAWSTQPIGRHAKHKGSDINWKYTIGQGPSTNRNCEHCGSKTHIAGPMWGGPLHNPAFIEKILDDLKTVDIDVYQTKARVEGMLDTALDEMSVNSEAMDFRNVPIEAKDGNKDIVPKTPPEAVDHHPFFFIPSALCKVIKAQAPPEVMIKGAIRHAGYRATRSHCKPGSIKTDAPWTVIWEILREWTRQKAPIKEGALQESSPGWKIMQAMRKTHSTDSDSPDTHTNGRANRNGTSESTPDIVTEEQGAQTPPERPADPADVNKIRVVFDEQLGKDKPGKRLVRYQENPRENWGPMRKAQGSRPTQSKKP